MSTLVASNLKNASATNPNIVLNTDGTIGGDCLTQTCRAWVNFNGTGTVAIRASYNVSSITDNGTGDYTVNFTTAMVDANYAVNVSSYKLNSFNEFVYISGPTQTASLVRLANASTSGTFFDTDFMYVALFR